jgi:hypothetical protein
MCGTPSRPTTVRVTHPALSTERTDKQAGGACAPLPGPRPGAARGQAGTGAHPQEDSGQPSCA